MKVRWWKTKTNQRGVKTREKKSREKIIEIISVEKDKDAIYSNNFIMNKIKNKLGLSPESKVDIVIVSNLKEKSLGMSNDVY
jgi:hypothetical protein